MKASEVTRAIRQSLDADITYAKNRKASLNNTGTRAGIALFAKTLSKAQSCLPGMVHHTAYVYAGSSSVNASISATVESLKGSDVAALFEWMLDNVGSPCESMDYASESMAERTFSFRTENLTLDVSLGLPTDGDACRRIKTGVKLVEQATYALECA